MLRGEILRSIVLLFHLIRGHIFASVEKLVHMYEMWQMNRLWLAHLYCWYFPDLTRLAN